MGLFWGTKLISVRRLRARRSRTNVHFSSAWLVRQTQQHRCASGHRSVAGRWAPCCMNLGFELTWILEHPRSGRLRAAGLYALAGPPTRLRQVSQRVSVPTMRTVAVAPASTGVLADVAAIDVVALYENLKQEAVHKGVSLPPATSTTALTTFQELAWAEIDKLREAAMQAIRGQLDGALASIREDLVNMLMPRLEPHLAILSPRGLGRADVEHALRQIDSLEEIALPLRNPNAFLSSVAGAARGGGQRVENALRSRLRELEAWLGELPGRLVSEAKAALQQDVLAGLAAPPLGGAGKDGGPPPSGAPSFLLRARVDAFVGLMFDELGQQVSALFRTASALLDAASAVGATLSELQRELGTLAQPLAGARAKLANADRTMAQWLSGARLTVLRELGALVESLAVPLDALQAGVHDVTVGLWGTVQDLFDEHNPFPEGDDGGTGTSVDAGHHVTGALHFLAGHAFSNVLWSTVVGWPPARIHLAHDDRRGEELLRQYGIWRMLTSFFRCLGTSRTRPMCVAVSADLLFLGLCLWLIGPAYFFLPLCCTNATDSGYAIAPQFSNWEVRAWMDGFNSDERAPS